MYETSTASLLSSPLALLHSTLLFYARIMYSGVYVLKLQYVLKLHMYDVYSYELYQRSKHRHRQFQLDLINKRQIAAIISSAVST